MGQQTVIVSEDAKNYFKDNGINEQEWKMFCVKKFDLKRNDVVFYEGNMIGYKSMTNQQT